MNSATKVIIYDNEGNVILNDSVTSPFVGLQAGETFWYGSSNNKSWAKVISISYGLDTSLKCFIVEIVVEHAQKKMTKTAKPEFQTIDYGEFELRGGVSSGSEWKNKTGDIKVVIRSIGISDIDDFILVVEGANGPMIEKKGSMEIGEFVICKAGIRSVKCTLLSIQAFSKANFRVTEQIPI